MYIECVFIVAVKRPMIDFFSPNQTISLTTKNFTLKCTAIGYNVQYLWKNGSGSSLRKVTGTNTNVLVIPDVRSIHGIIYTCVASNEGGRDSSTALLVWSDNVCEVYKSEACG